MLLPSLIVRLVDVCTRHAWRVIAIGMLLAVAASIHSVHKFAINSDINTLLSPNLDWRKREMAFEQAFGRFQLVVAVVEAPTPELATEATSELTKALAQNKTRFREVKQSGGGAEFFARHALMFQSPEELQKNLEPMAKAEPLIRDLATDQSLRGLVAGMEDALLGVRDGSIKLDDAARVFSMASDTLDNVLAGRAANFSWRVLVEGRPAKPNDLRGFIEIKPVLDYGALEPGRAATDAIRKTASEILPKYQAGMRLTGPVPMADEEFATIKEDAVRNGLITVGIVLIILWLALRSKRLILAVFLNLYVGLALTASAGLMMVGALNLISVYFAVLYVGIGVDFGLQYCVRYRAERHEHNDLKTALLEAARHFGAPLTLAAGATAAGFLSFLPTHYTGVSELGLIAGLGMLIAFATSVTVLPAMIKVLNPPGEPEPLGFAWLAPLDAFLERRRTAILVGTVLIVAGGLPLFYWLHFDFNPVNLRSPETESVATYLDLSRDPDTSPNTIGVLAPSLKAADESAARLAKVAEVSRTMTLSSFVPDRQPEKLKTIGDAAKTLEGAFDPKNAQEPPNDTENVEALNEGAERLNDVVKDQKTGGPGVDAAKRLAGLLTKLAQATPEVRRQAEIAFLPPLKIALNGLQNALHPGPVTLQSLPADLVREWLTPEGPARVSVAPRDSSTDNEAMRRFARAVLAVEPRAIEGPISILEAGNTIVWAFIQAGFWALLSISILLWVVLRRIGDVLLTLIPLIVAAAVTLELTVLIGLPMNFANIIALPLLLGVGVAFKIYYIMAWREGQTNLLQTSLTRAVVFSALTTATAFGSLWFSSHPGTSSMGKLLALSLACTMFAAVLFQPLLMGKPRTAAAQEKA